MDCTVDLLHQNTSRQDTTHERARHLMALPLFERAGTRGWTHRTLKLWVAESRKDRTLVSDIVLRRHYLARRATPPKVLVMSYLGALEGGEGAAVMCQVALLPANLKPLLAALGLHPAETLTLTRLWRSDDLTPEVAPDLTPYTLRQVVRRLPTDWAERKSANLAARPRLLVTWADPAVGHDGATYIAAGAVPLGPTRGGKLLFAWALDPDLREPLRAYARRLATRASA